MERLARRAAGRARPARWTGTSTASSSTRRTKLRDETRKILELPELPISATCVRVPVMVGHAEAIWVETERAARRSTPRDRCSPRRRAFASSRGFRSPGAAAGTEDVLVGRIRQDPTEENGLVLFLACDNLRKGAALNAIQIAELLLNRAASLPRPCSRSTSAATGRCGTGAGATTCLSARTTRAVSPSSTGTSPPSSSRASSTRPCDAHGAEAEVGEEVRREDGAVDEEPLVLRLALAIAVGERLERLRAAVLRVADRGEEERLHHPRRADVDHVRAGDQHRVVRRRAGRQLGRPREQVGRPVLHRPEQPAVVVVVDGPPRAPLLLGLRDPAALVGPAIARDCHHTHSWQTVGAVSSVAPVSPVTRGGIAAG